MGGWDDYDRYMQEDALEEFLQESLKSISVDSTKHYLGTYGDAIQERVLRCLAEAKRLQDGESYAAAVVNAATSIELIIRFMLLRPLVQGSFLSDEWAAVLANRVANGRSAEDKGLLPAVLRQWGIDVNSLTLADGSLVWPTILNAVWPLRNKIVHQATTARDTQAATAIECAEALLSQVVNMLARNLGFTLGTTGRWSEIRGKATSLDIGLPASWSQSFHPASPFDDAG